MRSITIIMCLFFAVGCKPDASHRGDEHAKVCTHSLTSEEYDIKDVVDQPGAKLGDLTRCPISGSVFRVTETSPSVEQKGEMYYTCCGGCIEKLEASFARRR